jgi:lysophospholipase L1-like esterase
MHTLLWRGQIKAYERTDRASPPSPGVIVFTGSSSIRLWTTLAQDMQPLPVINRGFGGALIADVNHYAQRVVIPYQPRAVVLYAGDNDLAFPAWKSPRRVLDDFSRFAGIVRAVLPDTWIYYISIKPSPHRDWPLIQRTNRMIAEYIRTLGYVQFIDVSHAMLDAEGELRRDLYDADPLHMNAAGYVLWTSIVRPVLMERFAPST